MLFVPALAANVVVLLPQQELRLYLFLGSAASPRRRRPSSITPIAATRFFFFALLLLLSSIQDHSPFFSVFVYSVWASLGQLTPRSPPPVVDASAGSAVGAAGVNLPGPLKTRTAYLA